MLQLDGRPRWRARRELPDKIGRRTLRLRAAGKRIRRGEQRQKDAGQENKQTD